MINTVFLSLGSNLGDKTENIKKAIAEINSQIGAICNTAKFYETEPWGFENDSWFLNTAVKLKTEFSAKQTLKKCLSIENQLGRYRNNISKGYSSRIIDIDILFFNNELINLPDLIIPHPYIKDRKFVLYPLMDITTSYIHPVLKKSIRELVNECTDKTIIKEIR